MRRLDTKAGVDAVWRKRLGLVLVVVVAATVGVQVVPAARSVPLFGASPAWAGAPASPPAVVNPSPVVVLVSAAGPTMTPSQIATDTVWGPLGSPYVVSGELDVLAGVSLTLLPGTVVKFGPGVTVQVHGVLLALGTPRQRVVFSSVRDDSVGGDSNGDGAASVPAVGDWAQIVVRGGSAAGSDSQRPVSVLDYADVRFGGYSPSCGLGAAVWAVGDAARLVVSNSSFANVRGGVRVDTKRDRFGFTGIYNSTFSAIDGCAVTSDDASAEIVGNTFAASVGTAWYSFLPRGERFWFNTAGAVVSFPSATPLPAGAVDVRYNALLGGVAGPVPDISRNWWGTDINVLPPCLDPAVAAAANPPITTAGSGPWPPDPADTAGFAQPVTPALSASLTVLPAAAREAAAPRYGPVNTYSGVLSFARTDLSVPDAGAALVASRIYRSDVTSGPDAGPGWLVSYSEGLSTGGGVASMALPEGQSLGFLTDPAAGYVPAPGVAAAYSFDAGGTTVTAADQTGYRFDPAGELTGMTLGDPGHAVTVSRSGGRPARVTGVSGRYLDYQRTGGLVSAVADSAGRRVGLVYSGGRLAAVSGVDGQAESYGYDGQGRLTTITSPMGRARLAVGYDGANRVAWLERQGLGRVVFDYRPAEGATVITQPDGGQTRQEYDFAGRLVAEQVTAGSGAVGGGGRHVVYDGEGHLVLDITGVPNLPLSGHGPAGSATLYDGSGDPVLTVDPVGGFVAATFDARHRPLMVTQSVTATSTAQTVRTYTPEGRLSTVTAPVGKGWQFTANCGGKRRSQHNHG